MKNIFIFALAFAAWSGIGGHTVYSTYTFKCSDTIKNGTDILEERTRVKDVLLNKIDAVDVNELTQMKEYNEKSKWFYNEMTKSHTKKEKDQKEPTQNQQYKNAEHNYKQIEEKK